MNDGLTQNLPQAADYVRILPELILSLFGILVMVLEPVDRKSVV